MHYVELSALVVGSIFLASLSFVCLNVVELAKIRKTSKYINYS